MVTLYASGHLSKEGVMHKWIFRSLDLFLPLQHLKKDFFLAKIPIFSADFHRYLLNQSAYSQIPTKFKELKDSSKKNGTIENKIGYASPIIKQR